MMKRSIAASLALLLALAVPAFAHEHGAIYLASNRIPVGGQLSLRGEKLSKRSALTLVLRGTLEKYTIGSVRTDSAGKFQAQFTLPPQVKAGAYSLVAIASDGDVTARADLAVIAAATPAAARVASSGGDHATSGMAGMPGMNGAGSHATEAMMDIPSTTTPAEWAVIVALIVLSFVGGGVLLRKRARTND